MIYQFHVGQKVVALKSHWIGIEYGSVGIGNDFPLVGNIYVVAEIDVGEDDKVYLALVGFPERRSFLSSYFRPVVESETDISQFKAMLNKPTVRVDA